MDGRHCYTSAEQKSHSRLKYVVAQVNRKIVQYKEVGQSDAEAQATALNFFDTLMREQRTCATLSGLERYLQKKMKEEKQAQAIQEAYEQAHQQSTI